jgi:hypothetical protein
MTLKKTDSQQGEHTHPRQLGLFELKIGNERFYSNTIAFWDMIPKFYYGKMNKTLQDIGKKTESYSLPMLEREVYYKLDDTRYHITITPAIIKKKDKKDGKIKPTAFYPSTREELIEDVLRKFLAEGRGSFFNNNASISFSLRDIQQELKKSKHTYSLTEIKEALEILNKTHIEAKSDRGGGQEMECSGNMLIFLALATKGNASGATRCIAQFNPFVTKSIQEMTFRKYDFSKCIGYQVPLARYIHKRISHQYKQISKDHPYIIKESTLINDSGYNLDKELRKRHTQVESALEELKAKGTIVNYHFKEIIEKKNVRKTVVDYKIYIIPSEGFISDIISANTKEKHNKLTMEWQK